jgi:DNA-binding NtrC family response regulator
MIARVNEVPPSCAHLDRAAIEAALVETCGNVSAAAKKLRAPPSDLRRLMRSSSLADVLYEQIEQTLDEALQVAFDGLKSPDPAHRQMAAKSARR